MFFSEIGILQEQPTMAQTEDDSSDFPIAIVAGIAAGLLLVIVILIVIIVCCCRVLYSDSKYLPPERIGYVNIVGNIQCIQSYCVPTRSRRYLIRGSKRVAKKKGVSNGEDSPDAEISVDKATPNTYSNHNEMLESITDRNTHYYSTMDDNVTKPSGDDVKKGTSDSPSSVTSPDVSATINPALGITEEKGNRNSDVAIQLDDLPSQELPQLVNVPRESPAEDTPNTVEKSTPIEQSPNEVQSSTSDQQSTPKKGSKRSLLKFHGWKKSKRPSVEQFNPLFEKLDQGQTDNKELQHSEETPATLNDTYNEVAVDVIPSTTNNDLTVDFNQEPSS